MTLEKLREYRRRVESLTDTMAKDCQYLEDDIRKSKDDILLGEAEFCRKMHEYEKLMPNWSDVNRIKDELCAFEQIENPNKGAPLINDIVLRAEMRICDIGRDCARIKINICHSSFKYSYSSSVITDGKSLKIGSFRDACDDERESAIITILKNQDRLFEMMGELVLKVNEKYAEMLKQYNERLLADAKEYMHD